MTKKVLSLKERRYEKMYESFYKNPNNCYLSVHCFFKSDVIINKKTKIS